MTPDSVTHRRRTWTRMPDRRWCAMRATVTVSWCTSGASSTSPPRRLTRELDRVLSDAAGSMVCIDMGEVTFLDGPQPWGCLPEAGTRRRCSGRPSWSRTSSRPPAALRDRAVLLTIDGGDRIEPAELPRWPTSSAARSRTFRFCVCDSLRRRSSASSAPQGCRSMRMPMAWSMIPRDASRPAAGTPGPAPTSTPARWQDRSRWWVAKPSRDSRSESEYACRSNEYRLSAPERGAATPGARTGCCAPRCRGRPPRNSGQRGSSSVSSTAWRDAVAERVEDTVPSPPRTDGRRSPASRDRCTPRSPFAATHHRDAGEAVCGTPATATSHRRRSVASRSAVRSEGRGDEQELCRQVDRLRADVRDVDPSAELCRLRGAFAVGVDASSAVRGAPS